jgi:His-Xaa-Ser system protein HxsD
MPATVIFSSEVYSLETVKKAAYRLSDLMSVDIALQGDDIVCVLHFDPKLSDAETERVISSLRTEVIDQDLRAIVGAETAPIRNAILGYAFSKTGLLGGE